MRGATEVADELWQALPKAFDDWGAPSNEEAVECLLPLVQKRDREVTIHALETVDLAIEKEQHVRTGQAAFTLGIARSVVAHILGSIGVEREDPDT